MGEPEELEDDSSDDEEYDVVAQDEEPLYELGGECNSGLEACLAATIG